ncbi:uncharacterized protein SPSK_01002 [Sporothrix schenckii 1099-18]|uniref:Survival protein SurE-like phosphatase/nucleotidase domain-containing protein n=1 Tax=Sporothrix schenckii 1099-18 TaxID=1397361 RepID=A0A0F2LZK2_SPOSC|nr:uncharacterized protein SPSK_01002 [Sporothrix schenckii 1099-18]KJR81326.1 hypothetical protein SPSK_01002 [Sporothrix schenckii 1099-18]
MHILIVNDDGPPSTHSSPYVHSLVRELQQAGHLVSVCLPHTQRSWIGKAHIIGQTVEPTYYRPPPWSSLPAGITQAEGEPGNAGTVHTRPFRQNGNSNAGTNGSSDEAPEEWVLVNGTPASCVQIGLFHVFKERPPIDLVVSGPNYGRNTTAVFALSSGTLGGALEAATCNKPAIALSYAFFSRNHDRDIIAEASRHAVRVIEALYRQWPKDVPRDSADSVDLYSVNVPLVAGVSTHKTVYAGILQNYWSEGGCFVAEDVVEDVVEDAASGATDVEEERLRTSQTHGETANKAASASERPDVATQTSNAATTTATAAAASGASSGHGPTAPITHRHFKWQPQFSDVYRSVDEAPPGNDGWAVREGLTSITPLKANFFQTATKLHQTEFRLDRPAPQESTSVAGVPIQSLSITEKEPQGKAPTPSVPIASNETLYALVAYEDPYVQPIILDALKAAIPESQLHLLEAAPGATLPTAAEPVSLQGLVDDVVHKTEATSKVLQLTPYEVIDFDYAARHAASTVINSYIIRKALIRKHFLANTVEQWVAKRPQSVLAQHVQRTETFEVDYAEFLDDALVEAFDLRASLAANEDCEDDASRQWWILKPSMSDRGQGIRLFSTMEGLQGIFDGWEAEQEEAGEEGFGDDDDDHNDAVAAADLRHFVAQPYIHPPLLLPGTNGRKFHIRVYVLCVGALRVYVHRDMLALFAAKAYTPPWETEGGAGGDGEEGHEGSPDLAAHLTNTCLQDEADKGDSVRRFWDLEEPEGCSVNDAIKDAIFDQICRVTGETFEAAAVAAPIHFQPLGHAFEVYGLDFLVSASSSTDASPSPSPTAWLLEVNAFPDFRQTGTGLQDVVAQFWQDTLRLVVRRQVFGRGSGDDGHDDQGETASDLGGLVLVKDVSLGRR